MVVKMRKCINALFGLWCAIGNSRARDLFSLGWHLRHA